MTNSEIKLILLTRRSLIQFNNKFWTRKDTPNNFDILIGPSDSAAEIDLVGLFLLKELEHRFRNNKGDLYRDDGLFTTKARPKEYNNTIT